QNTFCPEGGVCKHGFLIKSPPLQLFSSQNSWKRRLFVLSKSSTGKYILKYLKGQHVKGSIAVDHIISIEVGISNAEIMETVRKMFKCLPEQVMSISTGNRCYYLIGNSRQEIEDWVTLISSICREDKRTLLLSRYQGEIAAQELLGFCSHKAQCKWPRVRKLNVGQAHSMCLYGESTFFLCMQQNGSSEDKNRPYSDPGPHKAQCDPPRGVFPSLVSRTNKTVLAFLLNTNLFFQQDKILGRSEENLLLSDPEEDIKRDEEDYYQTPSNVLAKLLDERCQLTCRRDGLPSPPKCQNNTACPRDLEADKDTQFPESSTSLKPTLQRRQNSLPLSVVHLSILLSQITDEMQLQKLDIFVPLADINNYLKLTEAAGRI
ncbi:PKHS1 protein, partial [Alaudala cheleensis]|nr:PKHS1 protein [Alaudala cheleensis]